MFYLRGQESALEKLGQAGLLRRALSASKDTLAKGTGAVRNKWRNTSAPTQGLIKRLGVGAAIGAPAGSVIDADKDKTVSGRGALLGGALGAAALAGLGGHLRQRSDNTATRQWLWNTFSNKTTADKGTQSEMLRRLQERAQRKILPRLSEAEGEHIIRDTLESATRAGKMKPRRLPS